MYTFHFGKLLPLYVAVIEHSSVPSPSVYFSLSPHFCLFPSPPASSLTSSIPSECWAPPSWHSDCSYHFHQIAIVHVFVMLNTIPLLICTSFSLVPPRLPPISPLISHTNSMCWSLYMFPSFSTCSFSPHPPLSKQVLQRLSVISVTFISLSACKHRNGGEDGGTVMDLDCRRCWACRKSGTEPLKRGGPNQKDLCLESLILVIWFKKTSSGLFLTLAELTATHSGRYERGIDHFTSSY